MANRLDPKKRVVFYSVAAQWDNLGDIEIRDTALGWIGQSGSRVVAFTGGMPTSYLNAFQSAANTRWISSSIKYQGLLWGHILRRRASIVFAPGPQVFASRPKPMLKSLVNLLNVLGVRLSGGSALAVGRALRGSGRMARALERAVVSRFSLYVVRDDRSASVIGRPLRDAPDLAFGHPRVVGSKERVYVAISLRSDREVNIEGLKALLIQVSERGLVPVFVSQVKRDDVRHSSLAAELSVEALLWGENSHASQMERVKNVYARSAAIVSNRLHGLILGVQNGASPIAVLDPGSDKLSSTLAPWVPLRTTSSRFEGPDGGGWKSFDFTGDRAGIDHGAQAAAAALDSLRADFLRVLDGQAADPRRLDRVNSGS
ncbi:polysaccharide pyruvyl transferase family protein [Herbiconiux daphne]|uniref:Polysaccharide pyruvyl transferase family protein n=1 Tax=Herbiconiux daphne TaxID=2970914 RepID=A0ABT2H6K8_9MICO|nr:polysaccharide pyruvyl transferase family protein [Herbiconiux daphne]MCS5735576.1 polysaccharide pyruvyl transferase family protein [Herbiconiux daphne]